MRVLALLVVVGCASGGEPSGEPVTKPSGGSSQGGTASSSAGSGTSEAGTSAGAPLGGAGAGGAGGGQAGSSSSSGAPAAGTGGAAGSSGGSVARCDQIASCKNEPRACTANLSGNCGTCKTGSYSCGDTVGFYAEDGSDFPCKGADPNNPCAEAIAAVASFCAACAK